MRITLRILASKAHASCPVRSFLKSKLQTITQISLGDSRVNLHPHLTAMSVIWHREHNRLARELKNINPHWSDDKLFHEARRIVIAQMQHITYNEWLPVVLGKYTETSLFFANRVVLP